MRIATRLGLAVLGLVVFVWLAIQVYLSQRDPENYQAWEGPYSWIIGPPGKALRKAAQSRIQEGLSVLNDPSRPPAERIEQYREHLKIAEELLVRSLRAMPADALALSQLAAIRWELEPPLTEEAVQRHLELVEVASRVAPRVPEVQMRLGELLLKMGRPNEALDYLHRTVELRPSLVGRIVTLLRDYLFTAEEIFQRLPRGPETLVALRQPFYEDGKGAEYLDLVDPALDAPTASLLLSFGSACLRARDPDRLLRRMESLGLLQDTAVEAERLVQRSRAHLALGDSAKAIEDARRAWALLPEQPRLSEHLGTVAMSAGEPEEAVEAFRHSLGQTARRSGGPRARARLNRRIGQALEQQGKGHLGYDAYKKALILDPEEAHAKRRVREMEEAAGVRAEP